MLFGNADIKIPLGAGFREGFQPRSVAHGSGDRADARVFQRELRQRLPKHIGKARLVNGAGAQCRVELSDAVVCRRHFFRQLIALALFGDQVQQHRLMQCLCDFQKFLDLLHVVPVDGSKIGKAEAVKQIRAQNASAETFF